ncbi:flavin reductase family protein [Microtetraspora sp. AC03309]|uniref:flavin reductase family protein n=1 Tax=Microtetraspora sp. AC03309 TaxID=2779376 RepID=UPI001E64259F|nr:flavin reductase family protein [Microtetraspora sp. AC03309]MCC5575090.1 flavin reductase family protein [Microtetraspora sp. AC03309]
MSTDAARLIAPDTVRPASHGPAPRHPASEPALPSADGRPGHRSGRPGRIGQRASLSDPSDGKHFRNVLGRFATGVVAVTAIDAETGLPYGLVANSFTSVSLDPPLVAFCVAHTSTSWPRVKAAGPLCVTVLADTQRQVCDQLAARGGDKFAGLSWSLSPAGGPVFDGALAWLDCTIEAEHPAGDHVIVVARVHGLDKHEDGNPLVFFRGDYGRFHA